MTGNNNEQKYYGSVINCISFIENIELELYQIAKELVGGICQWVLKRINRPKVKGEQGGNGGSSGNDTNSNFVIENSWVKKIQMILKS